MHLPLLPLERAAAAASLILLLCASCSDPAGGVVAVNGHAIGNDLQPVIGAQVRLTSGDFSATTTTDAAGAFSVAAVPLPYDAMLAVVPLAEVTLYQGLTRADPTLVSLGTSVVSHPSATLGGVVSGGVSPPLPPNHRTRVSFGSAEGGGVVTADGATGDYQFEPSWWGASTTTGNLYALQWQYDAAGLPVQYTGFASKSGVVLTDGATVGGEDLLLGPVGSGTLAGGLAPAASYTPVSRQLFLVFGTNQALDLLRETTSAPGFSYLTPTPPQASLLLIARAASATASSTTYTPFPTAASGVSVPLPPAASLVSPAEGAVGVSLGTAFSWTPTPGGVSLLVVRGAATVVVVTQGASASLAAAATSGVGFPTSAGYTWYVFGVGPFTDLDAAAGPGGYLGPFVQPQASVYQTQSASRTFTSAP